MRIRDVLLGLKPVDGLFTAPLGTDCQLDRRSPRRIAEHIADGGERPQERIRHAGVGLASLVNDDKANAVDVLALSLTVDLNVMSDVVHCVNGRIDHIGKLAIGRLQGSHEDFAVVQLGKVHARHQPRLSDDHVGQSRGRKSDFT